MPCRSTREIWELPVYAMGLDICTSNSQACECVAPFRRCEYVKTCHLYIGIDVDRQMVLPHSIVHCTMSSSIYYLSHPSPLQFYVVLSSRHISRVQRTIGDPCYHKVRSTARSLNASLWLCGLVMRLRGVGSVPANQIWRTNAVVNGEVARHRCIGWHGRVGGHVEVAGIFSWINISQSPLMHLSWQPVDSLSSTKGTTIFRTKPKCDCQAS